MITGRVFIKLTGQNGQALIGALLVMIMLFSLGTAILLASVSVQKSATLAVKQKKAYYIAEAGVNQAIALVAAGENNLSSIVNEPYAGGIITAASCSGPVMDVYTVCCTAKYPDPTDYPDAASGLIAAYTLTAKFKLISDNGPGSGLEQVTAGYFRRGLWTGSLVVGSGSQINSNIYTNGKLQVANGGSIGDNSRPVCVYTDSSVILDRGGNLYGDIAARGDIDLSAGATTSNSLTAVGDITLGPDNRVNGAVVTGGKLDIDGSTVNQLQAVKGIDLEDSCTVQGTARTARDLLVGENCNILGSAWTMGDLMMEADSRIDGMAHVHGSYCPSYATPGCIIAGGPPRQLNTLTLKHPDVAAIGKPPIPNLDYYKLQAQNNHGHCFDSSQTFHIDDSQLWNGIYYVEGNLMFDTAGKAYAGKATLAASGNIVILDNQRVLPVAEGQDSLVLIAGNRIQLGPGSRLNAFLWAGHGISMGGSSALKGAMISPMADFSNGPVVIDQVRFQDRVIMTSWQ